MGAIRFKADKEGDFLPSDRDKPIKEDETP
jgi:hypothetical protein